MQTNPKHTNQLAGEKSPYLLQHAHNPVQWFPWGPEAWEKAKSENKPVFLSVGYSACHWCHIMERESFENEATAALLNAHFVSIKVDREERPDVDEIYMTAVQMLTGHGGWPMSVFLTPQGLPFYGGTYFPPEGRGGRISFPSLLSQLADAWKTRNAEVAEVAQNIAEDLQKAVEQKPQPSRSGGALNAPALVEKAVADMASRFDTQNGGFGNAPKFPPHHALRLLTQAAQNGNETALAMLTTTLDKMALGGIYDHIGGGFHRYSTDAVWLLPHFEKMLYDNALLARVYADADHLNGRDAYARIARETCDFILRDMTEAENGGFHAALDADSEGEEGKFYVWTYEEAKSILGAAAGMEFCRTYQIVPGGNFRDEATGHQSGANIPHLHTGAGSAFLFHPLGPLLQAGREKLFAVRNKRVWPGKDDKIITSWNGLMIGALAFCGATLTEPRYLDAARRAADFCLTTLRKPDGHLMRRWARGEAGLPAFLDDYAYLADGLLDLHDATGEEKWAQSARDLANVLLADFHDKTDGGFFYTEQNTGGETLIAQTKALFDGATPSPNGVAVRVLVRLGNLPGGEKYQNVARETLTQFGGLMERAPQGTATLILAAADLGADGKTDAPVPPPAVVSLAVQAGATGLSIVPGKQESVAFVLRLAPGFHVNAAQTDQADLIPARATLTSDLPAAAGPIAYPPATLWNDGTGGPPVPVYEGEVTFRVPVHVSANAAPGTYTLTLSVSCQPCSQSECLMPVTVEAKVSVNVEQVAA